ncbi:MAG: PhnD/SsuA/transferrin family substrate-binding protein [Oscillospiraceae bacterium]|nr:PhnD/SsuA/transferrin family substrate-binding protein [Oscillospiraceae bacterium]
MNKTIEEKSKFKYGARRFFICAVVVVGIIILGILAACSPEGVAGSRDSTGQASKPEKILLTWEPTESTADFDSMRQVFADSIAEGAGVPCESVTTTDYNVAIESIISGKVHMASLGAYEYVEAHKKNPAVEIAFVLSNSEGKLDPTSYHSQVLVREEDADQYMSNGEYSIDGIEGKNYSFVSLSSTSGFIVPSNVYMKEFSRSSIDDFSESGRFFKNVLIAGSHVNSLFNLLRGEVDLASCDDTGTASFYNVESGANGEVGSVYVIRDGLDAPLDAFAGQRVVVVASFSVPAVPFCVNTDVVDKETLESIISYMCSKAVSDNPEIFLDVDSTTMTRYRKTSADIGFVPADDAYYDSFRQLIGED